MLFSPVRRMAAQTCADSHYRWTVRIADSLASVTPTRTSISAMLNTCLAGFGVQRLGPSALGVTSGLLGETALN